MSTADVTADAGAYEERSLFVRKATGLVRGWAVRDAFIYSVFAINLVTLGFYIFSFGPFIPKGSLLWAVILSGAYLVFQAITYASLIAAMSDAYVIAWKTRYAPDRMTAHSRLPAGMNGPYEKMYRPRVIRLTENAA